MGIADICGRAVSFTWSAEWPVRALSLAFIGSVAALYVSCGSQRTVSGVWREVPLNASGEVITLGDAQSDVVINSSLYELNLGQYGDRVAGVSVRYQVPDAASLALFDQRDRCGCAFIVQGLIEELEDPEEDGLLFVAQGLTFSLYTPPRQASSSSVNSADRSEELGTDPGAPMSAEARRQSATCPQIAAECRRIFDVELVEGGDALVGETWCLDDDPDLDPDRAEDDVVGQPNAKPQRTRRLVRFEPINGIPEDVCETP